jgi:DNA uptake protein ComE-like DNA-binding protein
MSSFRKHVVVFAAVLTLLLSFAGLSYAQAKVDLNSATEQQLVDLPGVGKATAKKIIAGRPYSSVSDLSKAGVSNATITKITPLVTAGSGSAAPAASQPAAADTSSKASKKASKADAAPADASSKGPVDLNTASEQDLIDLPGIGKASAKKIIDNRPYASVSDLSKSGISKATITKITPMVTVSGSAAAAPSKPAPAPAPAAAPASSPAPTKSAAAASTSASTPAAAPAASPQSSTSKAAPRTDPAPGGGNGLVWVNTKSGVYHKEGDRWYGKTEEGKYMTEADALKAGYRAEKTRESKAKQ